MCSSLGTLVYLYSCSNHLTSSSSSWVFCLERHSPVLSKENLRQHVFKERRDLANFPPYVTKKTPVPTWALPFQNSLSLPHGPVCRHQKRRFRHLCRHFPLTPRGVRTFIRINAWIFSVTRVDPSKVKTYYSHALWLHHHVPSS